MSIGQGNERNSHQEVSSEKNFISTSLVSLSGKQLQHIIKRTRSEHSANTACQAQRIMTSI